MRNPIHHPIVTSLALGAAIMFVAARASANEGNEARAIAQAEVSLTQAISAAEQKTGGKAVDAHVESRKGAIRYEVEVAVNGQEHDVVVDGQTGRVLRVSGAEHEGAEHGEAGGHDEED